MLINYVGNHLAHRTLGDTKAMGQIFKPGAHGRRPRAWFLEIALVRASVCVCVCPPPWPLITRVRLVKQVLRLFPAFNYFIRHLPSIKWMGVAI